jgi:hypothetical protein
MKGNFVPGVNAPGTANKQTFFPRKISVDVIGTGISSFHVQNVKSGIRSPIFNGISQQTTTKKKEKKKRKEGCGLVEFV